MLLLGRNLNQSVRIGDVVVRVLKFRGRQVVLGIEAPGDVDIVRCELEGVNKPVHRVFTDGEDEVHGI
jgi:carbon storage regulator CsrA